LGLLDLSYTRLLALPTWLPGCGKLRVLNLSGLSELGDVGKDSLAALVELKLVDLSGTALGCPLAELQLPDSIGLVARAGASKEHFPKGSYTQYL
jgi:hypothetical protein